jgi:peptidoglycan/LPS O-acetylase OafA/YrhL
MRFVQQRGFFTRIRISWLLAAVGTSFVFAPIAGLTFPLVAFSTAFAIDRLVTHRWKIAASSFGRIIWNHLTWIGVISYSVYLLHQPFLEQAGNLLQKLGLENKNPTMILSACFMLYPAIRILSFFMYRLIGRPCISASSKAWSLLQRRNKLKQTL